MRMNSPKNEVEPSIAVDICRHHGIGYVTTSVVRDGRLEERRLRALGNGGCLEIRSTIAVSVTSASGERTRRS